LGASRDGRETRDCISPPRSWAGDASDALNPLISNQMPPLLP